LEETRAERMMRTMRTTSGEMIPLMMTMTIMMITRLEGKIRTKN
jgi:hypothetical protein